MMDKTNGRRPMSRLSRGHSGATLVEMIVVIVITGIIAGMVAMFIRKPVEGYVDAARRAELTDIADTALRRITRDLRTALPNSIRVSASGGSVYLEYLQTSGGGRYRAEPDDTGGGDTLDFTTADTTFEVIGTPPSFTGGEVIVVYNLTADAAVATANAYSGDNRAPFGSLAGAIVTLGAGKQFPFPSPGRRFQVVQYPVTYECAPDPVTPANGVLRRYWNYAMAPAQPVPPAGGSNALLATRVSACTFSYVPGPTQRTGVVALTLEITQDGESVRLFQQAHVSNVP